MTTEELKKSDLWWHGPEWLKEDADQWPTWNIDEVSKETIAKMLESDEKGPKILYETSMPANTTNNDNNQSIEPPFGISLYKYSLIKKCSQSHYIHKSFYTEDKKEVNS